MSCPDWQLKSMTNSDDYLQMSGIQHFCFCRRQWALAYMEQQWAENLRTAEGICCMNVVTMILYTKSVGIC